MADTKKSPAKRAAKKGTKKAPKKAPARRAPRAPKLEAAVHGALLEALKKPLTKGDLQSLIEPLALARTLAPEVRGITFVAAVAKKSKDSIAVVLVRALGAGLTRTSTAKQRVRLANAALDAMRGVAQHRYLAVAPEVLFLSEIAGTERFDRALRFYESVDLSLDGLVEKLLARAIARGEDALALGQLAAHAPAVRPIIATLRASAATEAERADAEAKLAALTDDQRFVFDQLLCGTADRENDHVWPSLARLLAAPSEQRIHRSALRNALATLRFVEGIEPLLQRAAEQPEARERLASLIDNDSSEYTLELVLHALRPYAGSPTVFARVQRAFEQPASAAGELCSEWFRDRRAGAWEHIDDAQAEIVIDAMIRADQAGVSEARHALFYVSHPGCERRIVRELARIHQGIDRKKNDDELYWSLVFALGHIATDSAVEFVRKLAFEATDGGVWECCSVLASTMTEARFESHLAAARAFSQPNVALSVLTTTCTDFIEKGALASERDRLLIELARVAALEPTDPPLRAHVLLEGIAAALRTLSPDVVCELSEALAIEKAPTKSKSLPAHTSRFCALRESEYDSPFAGDSGPKLLRRWAEALDGTLRSRLSSRRHGPIEGKLTDDVIEAVAGSPVQARLLVTADEVWFFGEDERLHVVDRSGVAVESVRLASVLDVPGPHLPRPLSLDARASLWTESGAQFIEAQRYGSAVFVALGANNGEPRRFVLRFSDGPRAQRALQTLRESPPKDFIALEDPWNLDQHGGLSREYYVRATSGADASTASFETRALHVVGHDDEDARRAEVERDEAQILADGGTLKTIEHLERLRRARDRSVHEWVVDRIRDDARDALWHLEALRDTQRAITASGIAVALEVQWGPPATEAELASLRAACAIPPALESAWRAVSTAGFRLGNLRATFLSPTEVLAQRPAWNDLRDALDKSDPRMARTFPLVVVEQDDTAVFEAIFDGAASGPNARPFTSVGDAEWWEASLSWIFATGMLSIFARALLAHEPLLAVASFGERATTIERVALTHRAKKWWKLVRVDRAVAISYGKDGARGTFDRTLYRTADEAAREAAAAIAAKRKQGYTG